MLPEELERFCTISNKDRPVRIKGEYKRADRNWHLTSTNDLPPRVSLSTAESNRTGYEAEDLVDVELVVWRMVVGPNEYNTKSSESLVPDHYIAALAKITCNSERVREGRNLRCTYCRGARAEALESR